MDNISTKYALHLDEIRRQAKIKVNSFCDGICSDRQYRRYLSGEQLITQKNILLFCEKLGLTSSDFYNSFYSKDMVESQKVNQIYKDAYAKKFDNALEGIAELRKHKFSDIQIKRLYMYSIVYIDYRLKKITMFQAYDQYKELINYPTCLDKKIFNFIDLITIHEISIIEHELDKEEAMMFLYKILFNKEFMYVSSSNRHVMPAIYSGLAKLLGRKKRLNEALDIADKGIKYCININDMHALPNLYYLKSLTLYKLGKVNESMLEAKKCLATTMAKDNINEYNIFKGLIKKHYNIESINLFKEEFPK